MPITHTEAVVEASANFLTDELPYNWDEMTDVELYKFILDHIWEPFERSATPAEEIFDSIEGLAMQIERIVKQYGDNTDG